jgi:transitional endoplasmic reticulum ATPase
LQKKQAPNSLLVDDSVADDHSTIAINPIKLEELKLLAGDTVLLRGKKRKSTVAVVTADENVPYGKITMSKVVRSNLR